MKFHLETKNLILRAFRDTDVDGILELDSNKEVHKYLGNNPIKTIEEAEKIISFFHLQYKDRGIGRFATIEKSSGKFIGWAGLKLNKGVKEMLNSYTDFIDIGYRFIPEFWGKGYATEASIASLEYGFKTLNYDIIYGAADIENMASSKVLKKIGLNFVNEFEFKDVACNWYELKKMNMEHRECLECGTLLKGRVDKKYCSDYCRNSYNNKVNKESKNLIRNINNRLRKNHKILSELNAFGKTKVTRTQLYDRGFDFQLFTSIYKTKTGNTYFYIYEQGYLALEYDKFLLIKREL